MEPISTVLNSKKWKIWHSVNYCIGGTSFLFGSILLFPYFATLFNSAAFSAWLYTIGSLCFCFSDYTEWGHYQKNAVCNNTQQWCTYRNYSYNFFLSFIGSSIYFIGSAMFIPQINKAQLGLYLFIFGSAVIFMSQSWKQLRVINQGRKINDVSKALNQDITGVLVDLFAGLGGLFYFCGSIVLLNPNPTPQFIGVVLFCCGGFSFYLSGMFMIKRYFIQSKARKEGFSLQSGQYEKDKQMVSQA